MSKNSLNLLLLHTIVLIFGFTGILGKLITLPSHHLVWYRMLIALAAIAMYMPLVKVSAKAGKRRIAALIVTGMITAAHWITFFEAIKVSTVSVTLACLSTATLFTALIEPLFFRRRISASEIIMGVCIIAGLGMIFSVETQYAWGIGLAVLSAFLASLFNVLNGIFIRSDRPSRIALYEMIGGVLLISVYLSLRGDWSAGYFRVSEADWLWLLLLGTVCTAFAFVVGVKVMETISPFTVSLTINLEPIYGIILAWFIFGAEEQMNFGFYLGAFVIFATVFTNAYLKRRKLRTS